MARNQTYSVARLSLLVFIIAAFLIMKRSDACATGIKTIGATYPQGDIIIEQGGNLTVNCTLNDDYVKSHPNASSSIMFRINNTPVPQDMVTIINESTIQLHIKNLSESESMYYCEQKTTGHAVCLNSVIVGTKPKPVEDFHCVSYNYENLTCSWTEPNNYVKTNYNLIYYFQGRSSRGVFTCPKIETNKSSGMMRCFWNLSTEPLYRQSQSTYFFTLTMSNILGNNSYKYNFSHFSHVIPEPPYNLTIINKTTNSIYLSWSVPIAIRNFPPGLVQRVVYQSEYDNKSQWKIANTSMLGLKESTYRFNLTGLKFAHALYDIRVSMRSSKALDNDTRWSRNASITARTMSKLPDHPPLTNIGSFEVVTSLANRDIYVYWQYIPDYMKNGENCTVAITVEENGVIKNLTASELTNTYAKFINLSLHSYKFTIASVNEIGKSVNTSVVYVPSERNHVPAPTGFTKIAFKEDSYELSWEAPVIPANGDPIESYTIFWCSNERDRPYQCKGYLQWEVVPKNTTAHNKTVPAKEIYQFAISANTKTASSGMEWASCTVIHNTGVGKMKNLWIDHIGSTFMEINWKLDCSDRIGNIDKFLITYCPIISPIALECKGELKNLTINGSMEIQGNVTGLRPYTTYMLTVTVITKQSVQSLRSEHLYNTTLEAVPGTPPQNVKIAHVTNSSITVTWSPPTAMNGVLRYYQVIYELDGRRNVTKVEPPAEKHNETEQKFVLEKLKSFTSYIITVTACTVGCSKPSKPIHVVTSVATPGVMDRPTPQFPNVSLILLTWKPPENPGGKLDVYELRIKESTSSGNTSKVLTTKELHVMMPNCHEDKVYKIYYFSVRAINIMNGTRYEGPWSPEAENYCHANSKFIYWVIFGIVLTAVAALVICFFSKKMWERCKIMRDVEVKLPPGLAPPIPLDLNMHRWPDTNLDQKNINDEQRTDTSADEELLLNDKKLDNAESHTGISGDSSGCSSGQESVISSLASGTNLSSTLDSGTEQPKTPSNESVSRENSLRLRKPGTDSVSWNQELPWTNKNKGYITMPTNFENKWQPKKTLPSSNYCVLGVNNAVETDNTGYVPLQNQNQNLGNLKLTTPFATCDTRFGKPETISPPPYVTTVDPNTLLNRGKILSYETSAPYSIALPTTNLINIDAGTNPSSWNYLQRPDETSSLTFDMDSDEVLSPKSPHLTLYEKPDGSPAKALGEFKLECARPDVSVGSENLLDSYCRLGWDNKNEVKDSLDLISETIAAPRASEEEALTKSSYPVEPVKSYVPHRHLENKMLKED